MLNAIECALQMVNALPFLPQDIADITYDIKHNLLLISIWDNATIRSSLLAFSGANTCEACKTFFRRTLMPDATMKPCKKSNQCLDLSSKGKISCASCRYKKCLAVGMHKEGIVTCHWIISDQSSSHIHMICIVLGCKKGRYTYEKRLNDLKEVKLIQSLEMNQNAVVTSSYNSEYQYICDELVRHFEKYFPEVDTFCKTQQVMMDRAKKLVEQSGMSKVNFYMKCSGNQSRESNTIGHEFEQMYSVNDLMHSLSLSYDQSLYEKTMTKIWQIMSHDTEKMVFACGNFAKRIQGFSSLVIEDRLIMVKSCFIELITLTQSYQWLYELDACLRLDLMSDDIHLIPLYYLTEAMFGNEYAEINRR